MAIGAHASDLSDWVSGVRPVPVHRCVAIERATNGAVTRRDLRPDDCHLIWPDLAISDPNHPQAPAHQARVAINIEAKEARYV